MKVAVTFTVDVDQRVDLAYWPPRDRLESAVAEAVSNAMSYAQGQGHVHSLDDEVVILMDSEVTAKVVD